MTTAYHAQYWAYALTLRGAADGVEGLSRAISNARVDLNPHQVDAALFAVQSPLSKGVILADEVGLGKTIEAGLVVSQKWAERRRRILVIVPASLRKQWQQELEEKFFLPSTVLESRARNKLMAEGHLNAFDMAQQVVICSYPFAARCRDDVAAVAWDLVVIDEAHRMRNIYKSGAKTAKAISAAIEDRPKLLLTATPLQNSLMELYGLVSVIDTHVFGDAGSFRDQFVRAPNESVRNRSLKQRLAEVCQRTLRRQVLEYVRFTRRVPVTQEFYPTDDEQLLYDMVTSYLYREELYALPKGQRTLITMVLRKLLASSSFAIADTLRALLGRLRGLQDGQNLTDLVAQNFEVIDELEDEWDADGEEPESTTDSEPIDPQILDEEIRILQAALQVAERITVNAKGQALPKGLAEALDRAESLGAARKAAVFTESRRTHDYLFDLLTRNGHAGKVVMLNGSNDDDVAKQVYREWQERHAEDGLPTGSRPVDMRAALTEEFKDRATILLATEAAAEGVNFQFCSLVVNFDLPWNPQRVEQRIGRCHRYGQKHDVVVVNFLNRRNAADLRVFQLLSEKFHLFEGVFGASDDILGTLESGVDIERRISRVYQTCRTAEEITQAFDSLQAELEQEIQAQMEQTRQQLLDNFDEDVQARLRIHKDRAQSMLDERGRWLLNLARYELDGKTRFEDDAPRFHYQGDEFRPGWYNLDWKDAEQRGDVFFRTDHPLAVDLIDTAQERTLPATKLVFDYSEYGSTVADLASYVGRSGWLTVGILTVDSLNKEEFLVLAAQTDEGEILDSEWCCRLLRLAASKDDVEAVSPNLSSIIQKETGRLLGEVEQRNGRYFDAQVSKLDNWSDDLKLGLERELKDLDAAIREARKRSATAIALADKLTAQREIKAFEKKRNLKRRDLYEEQDKIDEQRAELVEGLERQLATTHSHQALYHVYWSMV